SHWGGNRQRFQPCGLQVGAPGASPIQRPVAAGVCDRKRRRAGPSQDLYRGSTHLSSRAAKTRIRDPSRRSNQEKSGATGSQAGPGTPAIAAGRQGKPRPMTSSPQALQANDADDTNDANLANVENAANDAIESDEIKVRQSFNGGLKSLVAAVVIALFVITFVVQAFQIPSGSMEKTLLIGDYVLVDKVHFGQGGLWDMLMPYREIHRGDIVVFHYPVDPSQHFVKRVIGLP